LPSVGDHIRITAGLQWSGGAIQNVWHFRIADLGTAVDNIDVLQDAAVKLDDMYANLFQNISDQVSYTSIIGFNETEGQPMGTVGWPLQTVGGNVLAELPEACSAMVRIPTGLSKREGRKYFGGYTEGANDAGAAIAPGPLSNILLAMAEWQAGGILPNFSVQLQARVKTVQFGVNVYVAPQGLLLNNQWDYQRRRKLGVGI